MFAAALIYPGGDTSARLLLFDAITVVVAWGLSEMIEKWVSFYFRLFYLLLLQSCGNVRIAFDSVKCNISEQILFQVLLVSFQHKNLKK